MDISYNSNCLYEDKNGYKYSCDMLRIQGLVADNEECQRDFERYFNDPTNMRVSDTMISTAKGKYKNMWNIACKKTSITVLHCFNGFGDKEDYKRVILEFNPNKLEYDDFVEVQKIVLNLVELKVVRCDIAVDIPIERSFVTLVKDQRNYRYEDHNDNGITEYLGQRNNTNFVKVYDKQRESKTPNALTRIELTCEASVLEYQKHFPKILIQHEQIALETMNYDKLTASNKVLVEALKTLDVHDREKILRKLGRRIKQKISPYVLADTYELSVDYHCIGKVIDWVSNCVYYKTFSR